jgi:hypothetical protein
MNWWLSRNKPILNRDYTIENIEDAFFIVKIVKGKFNGTTYKYDKVSIDQSSYLPKLSFHYTVISSHQSLDYLQNSEDFVIIMGDILSDLVIRNEDAFRKYDYQEPH